ncbi:MAG: hypothetical protein ACR2OF_00950 [Hyphomicrobium sp.]
MAAELIRYDAMCRAIDAAYEVDEVKDIRDKALAIERYCQQAKNTEAERRACEIRLRAERKAGVLLKDDEERAKAGNNQWSSSDTTTLSDLGISRDQSSRWQKLAAVPEDDFEAALAAPEKPSTTGILAQPKQMPRTSVWVWGQLMDFEREGYLALTPAQACDLMTDEMLADVRRLAPRVAEWLWRLSNDIGTEEAPRNSQYGLEQASG